jgi:uncharacterized protein
MQHRILIVPGIYNSGPEHWQSLWEAKYPHFQRVMQRDWDHPVCDEWVAALEQAVADAGPQAIIVAHSMGCLTVAHWAASTQLPVAGALLVSVPDPTGPNFPAEAVGFAPVPLTSMPFKSIVVASSDDPYGSFDYMQRCASAWGSRFVPIGAKGHINASSGLGDWPEGYALLETLA